MKKILGQNFFNRNTLVVAEDLIGKFLVRKIGKKEIAAMIIETEAYDGEHDKASHAHKGKTERTKVMFGPAGYLYVYLCYGMYWMLNVVTGEKDYPAAVLIRAVTFSPIQNVGRRTSNILNEPPIKDWRASSQSDRILLCDGPGKLTRYFKIDKDLNVKRASVAAGLWFEDRGVKISRRDIERAPRIGVSYAKEWAKKPYRFVFRM